MIVACNLPSGLNLGFVTLTPAHRDRDYQVSPKLGMVGHLIGEDGREFLGSYALTTVDDAGLDQWARDNAGSTIISSGAVVWAPTLDQLISKLAIRRQRSHAPAIVALVLCLLLPFAVNAACPAQTSPGFSLGGSVFGQLAAQWNQYFAAKVNKDNGALCNAIITGSTIDSLTNTIINIPNVALLHSTITLGSLIVTLGDTVTALAARNAIGLGTTNSPQFAGLNLTGALTYGSVTLSNAVTGTGNMVLSISPTLTTPTVTGISSFTWAGPAWASYTGVQDQVRIVTNGYPINDEYFGGTAKLMTTLAVSLDVPDIATTDAITAGDQAIAGYCRTRSIHGRGCVGAIGFGLLGADGASVWGLAGVVANFPNFIGSAYGYGGGSLVTLFGAEIDMNIIALSGGGAPALSAFGIHISGASQIAPAPGYLFVALNINPAGPTVPWTTGVRFLQAAVVHAMEINSLGGGNSINSPDIQLHATSSGGVDYVTSIYGHYSGNLQVTLGTTSSFLNVHGGVASVQQVNGASGFYATRLTDSSPTGYFFEGVNATGVTREISIDVSGNVISLGLANFMAYYINGTVGASCSGVPTAGFVTMVGLVTHC